MNDLDFLRAFETCTLGEFHHRDHLRLTWLLVSRDRREGAKATIEAGIRRFARTHGQEEKYHQTMTEFWVDVIDHHISLHPETCNFEEFLAESPQLLDKSLPFRHWARETLMSDLARSRWVPPDLRPLPWSDHEAVGPGGHA